MQEFNSISQNRKNIFFIVLRQQRDAAPNIATYVGGLRYFLCPKERECWKYVAKVPCILWHPFLLNRNGGVEPGASAAKAEERPKGAEASERGQKADKGRGVTLLFYQ